MMAKNNSRFGVGFVYQTMLKYQKRYPLWLSLILLCLISRVAYDIILPLTTRWLFSTVLHGKNLSIFFHAMFLLGIAFLFFSLGNVIQAIYTPKLTFRVISLLRFKLFSQFIALNPSPEEVGKLNMHMISDLDIIAKLSIYHMWGALSNTLMIVFGTLALIYFDLKMTLLALIVIPLTLIFPHYFSRANQQQFPYKHKSESDLSSILNESIHMHEVIRTFRLQRFVRIIFRKGLIKANEAGEIYNRLGEFIYRSANIGTAIVQFLILLTGGYYVIIGQLDGGELIGFYLLLSNIMNSVNVVIGLYPSLLNAAGSLQKIETLLQQKNFPESSAHRLTKPFKTAIRFQNVSLIHKEHTILNTINLTIDKGKYIGIVGVSGSGKSTLLSLLLKFQLPTSGSILFDDIDYTFLVSHSLLSQFGVISQKPKLFSMSILENIRLGKLNASDEEVYTAAKKVGIHEDIIKLPEKYHTIVGDHVHLSGGQAQRVTIARAILSDPPILCFDEATSALDPLSGAAIESMCRAKMIMSP